ncbi:MAG: hypothetical protein ACXVHY_08465 [Methanobacterium sp.]
MNSKYVKLKNAYQKGGFLYIIQKVIPLIKNRFKYYTVIVLRQKKPKYFTFRNQKYEYFYHPFNRTWENERSIEIPIVIEKIKSKKNSNILELGNVLSNYFPVKHTILDKYANSPQVINEDVVNFKSSDKYDLIVSISTIEHVGWDEETRDPTKTLKALKNLKKLLTNKGEMILTFPLGFNHYLDMLLQENKIHFNELYYLKRISNDNIWIETQCDDISKAKYNDPFPFANLVAVAIIKDDHSYM